MKRSYNLVVPAALLIALGAILDHVAVNAVQGTRGDRDTVSAVGTGVAMLAFLPAVICLTVSIRTMAKRTAAQGVVRAVLWFCCALPLGFAASFVLHMATFPVQEFQAAYAIADAAGVDYLHVPDRHRFPAFYFLMQTTPGQTTRTEARSIMRYAARRYSCDGDARAAASRWAGVGTPAKSADLYAYLSQDPSRGQLAVLIFDEYDVLVARRAPEPSEYSGYRIENTPCQPF